MSYNSNYVSVSNKLLGNRNSLRWDHKETKQSHRGEFSRDRDRILYSKSFLRLRGKTQVFMLQDNDYIRTRLTHTLEVNQIAKTISIALGQNIELTEAIALGHDVGHTPFGHVGERTLAEILNNDADTAVSQRGFKHNLQALRLYCDLEKGADYPEYKGLNLTKYVLWGIVHHSKLGDHPYYKHYLEDIKSYWSIEGFIVALADEIAQRHHDIEDSLQYDILNRVDIVDKLKEFDTFFDSTDKKTFAKLGKQMMKLDHAVFSSVFSRLVINIYVREAIINIKSNLKKIEIAKSINNQEDFIHIRPTLNENEYKNIVSFSTEFQNIDSQFRIFLKDNVLSSYFAQSLDGKGEYIIRELFKAFKDNPAQLPDTAQKLFFAEIEVDFHRSEMKNMAPKYKEKLHRCIVDYIGGMTDRFAYKEYDRLYGTKF